MLKHSRLQRWMGYPKIAGAIRNVSPVGYNDDVLIGNLGDDNHELARDMAGNG